MDTQKNIGISVVVALIVSVFVSFLAIPATPAPVPNPSTQEDFGGGGEVKNTPDVYPNGIGIGANYITFSKSGTIGAGANTVTWKNTTGRTVYVDLAEMITTGTASSSYDFFVGTTSAATITDNFTDPFSTLVDAFRLATSTTVRDVNSIKDSGTNGRGVIPVTDGTWVFLTFQQSWNNACSGSVCETATSTNRGFNVNWYLRGHYKP